jgi:hypothetical protein
LFKKLIIELNRVLLSKVIICFTKMRFYYIAVINTCIVAKKVLLLMLDSTTQSSVMGNRGVLLLNKSFGG